MDAERRALRERLGSLIQMLVNILSVYIFDVLVIVLVKLGVEFRWSHLYMMMLLGFHLAEFTRKDLEGRICICASVSLCES